jgi:hypothetical protein
MQVWDLLPAYLRVGLEEDHLVRSTGEQEQTAARLDGEDRHQEYEAVRDRQVCELAPETHPGTTTAM